MVKYDSFPVIHELVRITGKKSVSPGVDAGI